jgi:hypothetical protein
MRGRLIRNLYQKVTFIYAKVVFSLILQIYPCNNAEYINTNGAYQGHIETGRLYNNSIYHFYSNKMIHGQFIHIQSE